MPSGCGRTAVAESGSRALRVVRVAERRLEPSRREWVDPRGQQCMIGVRRKSGETLVLRTSREERRRRAAGGKARRTLAVVGVEHCSVLVDGVGTTVAERKLGRRQGQERWLVQVREEAGKDGMAELLKSRLARPGEDGSRESRPIGSSREARGANECRSAIERRGAERVFDGE